MKDERRQKRKQINGRRQRQTYSLSQIEFRHKEIGSMALPCTESPRPIEWQNLEIPWTPQKEFPVRTHLRTHLVNLCSKIHGYMQASKTRS